MAPRFDILRAQEMRRPLHEINGTQSGIFWTLLSVHFTYTEYYAEAGVIVDSATILLFTYMLCIVFFFLDIAFELRKTSVYQ